MDKMIYMDNAATTRVAKEVFEVMAPYFTEEYANPSSTYTFAGNCARTVAAAKETIAQTIGCSAKEIYFTAGGSESDNWALKGIADAQKSKGRHIITSKIEHHAILNTCAFLEKNGYEVTYLNVDENGLVDPNEVKKAIRDDTILISVMFANNEIGTIEPVEEIGRIAHEHNVLFHTDAVQAFGHVPIDVSSMNIDLLSASGHKLNGPKGVGLLYIRNGVKITNLIHGGAQEHGRRAGTVNVPGIVGFAEAAKIASMKMEERASYEKELRDLLIKRVLEEIPYTRLNGDPEKRLSNNANFCFRFVEGESLLILLDQNGICASSGSACTSGSLDPSHVLLAIGLPHEIAHGSLRITISDETTREDIDYTADTLVKIISRLRDMSPLWEDFVKGGKK
ncbi:MAG: cysteine desulfurase NifS [Lachnospiraceae bacterium]|nr:cysteine desulfurase NifS [Lachnospiraceae bacterium]